MEENTLTTGFVLLRLLDAEKYIDAYDLINTLSKEERYALSVNVGLLHTLLKPQKG